MKAPRFAMVAALAPLGLLAACAQAPVAPSAPVVAAAPQLSPQDRLEFFVNDVRRGDCKGIDAALQAGVDIDAADTLNQTALIAAVSQNHFDCAFQLLQRSADPNRADHAGWTPLIHAAYFGASLELTGLLLQRGAAVNRQNDRGLTALYLASAAGHEQQVQLLLRHGADPRIASASGYTPVRVAQLRGLTRIVALLEAGPAADAATQTH